MKTLHLTFTILTAIAFGNSAFADDPPIPAPPPPADVDEPVPPRTPKPPRALPAIPAVPDLAPMLSDLQRQLQNQLSQVGVVVQDALTAVPAALAGGDAMMRQTARPGRTFVLSAAQQDAKAAAEAEEDLNVMARILDKALVADTGADERRAMGISVSMLGAPASAPRNLYLEGYGALFFLDVNFPLLPPPAKTEEKKAKAPVSSEWEEARREIDAARSPDQFKAIGGRAVRGAVEYDADQVERLKDSLLESLKNATHIRDLKPEESITLVVTGGGNARSQRLVLRRGTGGGGSGGGGGGGNRSSVEENIFRIDAARASGARGETTLTMRVKKSDADAFAQGKLDLEAFRKRATVRVY